MDDTKRSVTVTHGTLFALCKMLSHCGLEVGRLPLRFHLFRWQVGRRVFWLHLWGLLAGSRKWSSDWLTFFDHISNPCSTCRHHRSCFLCSRDMFAFRRGLWLTFQFTGKMKVWSSTLLASPWKWRSQFRSFHVCLSGSSFNRHGKCVPNNRWIDGLLNNVRRRETFSTATAKGTITWAAASVSFALDSVSSTVLVASETRSCFTGIFRGLPRVGRSARTRVLRQKMPRHMLSDAWRQPLGCSANIPADTVPAFELIDEVTLLVERQNIIFEVESTRRCEDTVDIYRKIRRLCSRGESTLHRRRPRTFPR